MHTGGENSRQVRLFLTSEGLHIFENLGWRCSEYVSAGDVTANHDERAQRRYLHELPCSMPLVWRASLQTFDLCCDFICIHHVDIPISPRFACKLAGRIRRPRKNVFLMDLTTKCLPSTVSNNLTP